MNNVSVENDHNVYILGAGFSRAAGLPLMGDFLNTMRDARPWLLAEDRPVEAEAIERVLHFRLLAAAAAYRVPLDLENIEHLFSLGVATPDAELEEALPVAIAATLDYSRSRAPEPTLPIKHKGGRPGRCPEAWVSTAKAERESNYEEMQASAYDWMLGLMTGYFGEAEDARNTVITFNYDTIVEDALSRLGLELDYGFGSGAVNYEWRRRPTPIAPCPF